VAGIEIRHHATFALLLAWIGLIHYLASHTWQAAFVGVLFVLALFGTIVLHELGHAFAARRFGVRTYDITLLPIGGVARLDQILERPLHKLLIALAGPGVNVVLAGLLFLGIAATGRAIVASSPDLASPPRSCCASRG
jgi:Zn-dependent protease